MHTPPFKSSPLSPCTLEMAFLVFHYCPSASVEWNLGNLLASTCRELHSHDFWHQIVLLAVCSSKAMAKRARTDADALTGELDALMREMEVLKARHEVEMREAVQAAVVRRMEIVERLMPTKAQRGLNTHPYATLVALAMMMGNSCEEDPIMNMLSDVDTRTIMAEAAKVDALDDKVEGLAKRLEFLKSPFFSDACPICCAAYAPEDGQVRVCPECKAWMCVKCAFHKSHGAGQAQHQCPLCTKSSVNWLYVPSLWST